MRPKIIYESYNNEFLLMKPFFSKSLIGIFFLYFIFYLERKICKKSDLIFTVSDNDRDSLSSNYNIESDKIKIAQNGVPVQLYNRVLLNRGGTNKKLQCIFIGSYHPQTLKQFRRSSLLLPIHRK